MIVVFPMSSPTVLDPTMHPHLLEEVEHHALDTNSEQLKRSFPPWQFERCVLSLHMPSSLMRSVRQQTADDADRTQASDPAQRPRFFQGIRHNQPPNGIRTDKKPPPTKQRVPNADEFPVLGGSTTPPSRSPGTNGTPPTVNGINGHGPTAAQVLQAPPPFRKEGGKDVRGSPAASVDSITFKVLKFLLIAPTTSLTSFP